MTWEDATGHLTHFGLRFLFLKVTAMDGVVTLAMDMVVTLATVWDTQDTVSSESFHFAVDSRLIEITKLTPFGLTCVYFRSFL